MNKTTLLISFLSWSLIAFLHAENKDYDNSVLINVPIDSTIVADTVIVADSVVVDSVIGTNAEVDSAHVQTTDTISTKENAAPHDDNTIETKKVTWQHRTDSITLTYQKALMSLIIQRHNNLYQKTYPKGVDAYSLKMLVPPTFYSSAVLQQFMQIDSASCLDPKILRMFMVDKALAKMYVNRPDIVIQTDDQVMESGTLRNDVNTSLTTETKLSDKVVNVDLGADVTEGVELVTRKPNFWKFSGNGSLQFTQNYFSENWFQGGENHYSVLGLMTLNMNYDNKQKLQWENKLEAQLGFQTTGESEQHHPLKPTNNLLRLTSKLGYKAYKTLFYTTQVQTYTQLVPLYESNSDQIRTDFLSPLNLTISVGLDYKFATKNNKFRGNVYMAPCAYNMRYVKRLDLAGRYGIEEDHHAFHNFGPSITVNWTWDIVKNVSWNSRMYWISNFEYTNIEWENTINFSINKYLSAKFYAYPKFDDSSKSYKGDHGYIMMKEWLSLGVNYSW